MDGYKTSSCNGSYGLSGIQYGTDYGTITPEAYNSSTSKCNLYDWGNFKWAETCPSGYVFNTEPNGAVTAATAGPVNYSSRYSTTSSNFNDERCYKQISSTPVTYDFVDDKYLVMDFPIVTENFKVAGIPQCTASGLGWDSNLNKCVGELKTCSGVFNSSTGKCEHEIQSPNCSTGYTYNDSTYRCEKAFTCPSGGIANPSSGKCEVRPVDPCIDQHIDGYDQVCATTGVCPTGSDLRELNGNTYCVSSKTPVCPAGFQADFEDASKCIAIPHCPDLWTETDDGSQCKRNYTWTEYGCNSGWTGPIENGSDCKGNCGFDGCKCNQIESQANNCKKPYSLTTGGTTYDLYEKRRMFLHSLRGDSLTENEFGYLKDMECGDDCLFNVTNISTHDNQICFSKGTGEKSCFKVKGCYFSGSIYPESGDTKTTINSLSLIDSHTLRSTIERPVSGGTCENGYTLDPNTNTCTKVIKSTCQMNGNVGWPSRSEGIVSISAGGASLEFVNLEVNGTATYNNGSSAYNLGMTGGNSDWTGFNIGVMALKLSDGNWYISKSFIDKNGDPVSRGSIPPYVKYLSNSYYQIDNNIDLNTTMTTVVPNTCNYKGHEMTGYCGNKLKIIMPNPKLKLVAVQDLESLLLSPESESAYPDDTPSVNNNTFDLTFKVSGGVYEYKNATGASSGYILPKDLVSVDNDKVESSITDETRTEEDKNLADRLVFWDSFKDGEIGFIEFVREVYHSDTAENFLPEYQEVYEAAGLGFNGIDFKPSVGKTILVKGTNTTSTECTNLSHKIKNSYVVDTSIFGSDTEFNGAKIIASLGGLNSSSSCVLAIDKPVSFKNDNWSVRKNTYSGAYTYKCSPYTCNAASKCNIATCPTREIDGVEYEFFGSQLPDSIPITGTECTAQICDANQPYIEYCGRKIGCDEINESVFKDESTDKCYEYYCPSGSFNTTTKTCETISCPQGTVENSDGSCSAL